MDSGRAWCHTMLGHCPYRDGPRDCSLLLFNANSSYIAGGQHCIIHALIITGVRFRSPHPPPTWNILPQPSYAQALPCKQTQCPLPCASITSQQERALLLIFSQNTSSGRSRTITHQNLHIDRHILLRLLSQPPSYLVSYLPPPLRCRCT